jgi:hypothetical protein
LNLNIEIVFLNFAGGTKVIMTSSNIEIMEKNGPSLVLELGDTKQKLSEEMQCLVEYVKSCKERCLRHEAAGEDEQQSCNSEEEPCFPVTIGRRPIVDLNNSQRSHSTSDIPSSPSMDNISTFSSGSERTPTVSVWKFILLLNLLFEIF